MKSPGITMALPNDNWIGYAAEFIVHNKVRWIEAAAASPLWTTMITYYAEVEQGHAMSEELGLQDYKIGARGNVFSFLMPWDDIMMEMNELTADNELAAAPHPPEVLQHMVRLVLRSGSEGLLKHLQVVRLRAHGAPTRHHAHRAPAYGHTSRPG